MWLQKMKMKYFASHVLEVGDRGWGWGGGLRVFDETCSGIMWNTLTTRLNLLMTLVLPIQSL